jgi:hypothetical protein
MRAATSLILRLETVLGAPAAAQAEPPPDLEHTLRFFCAPL